MDFSLLKHDDIKIIDLIPKISERRRGNFVLLYVRFQVNNELYGYEMKYGKKKFWQSLGFTHHNLSFGEECPHCQKEPYFSGYFCGSFKRHQNGLTKTLISHPQFIKGIKKVRLKLLMEHGFSIV